MDNQNYQKAITNCVSMLNRGKITQTEHNYIARTIMAIAEMTRDIFNAVGILNMQYMHDSGYTKDAPIGLGGYSLEPIYFDDIKNTPAFGISIWRHRNK